MEFTDALHTEKTLLKSPLALPTTTVPEAELSGRVRGLCARRGKGALAGYAQLRYGVNTSGKLFSS